ncbi:MAG: trigger factor [Candidatus Aadella gelida]|nr:trigger factor [Candidatus Aadella gelida]
MKSKMKKLEGTARELDIEVSKEAVENVFKSIVEDIQKTANVPGFRAGKAPIDLIKKKYSADAIEEAKRKLVPEAYQGALEEHGITPLSYPEFLGINISIGGELTFRAKVDTSPEVNLKSYKKMKADKDKVEVSEKESEEAFDHILKIHAEFVTVDRPLEKGDFGVCDVETFMDGKSISKKRENMWIEVDEEASMLGMGEKLCGLKASEEKDIEAELPENYPDKKYAGKKAVFHIKVKEVKEKKVPEANDDFAKKVGKEDIKSVKEEITSQLKERKEANEKTKVKNQIIEQLISKHKFDLPKSMVERQLKVFLDRAENELMQKGAAKEDIEAQKEKMMGKLREEAENKVRVYFILDDIAKKENIEVNNEEVDAWLKRLAASYNQSFEDTKKYYEENGLLGGLMEQLREDKTLDFLVEEAVITQK